jgi:hypothetical protein
MRPYFFSISVASKIKALMVSQEGIKKARYLN